MPRIERYTTDESIPVKREQIIDPSRFPFSVAGAEAFKTIGGVVEELAKRKMDADDALAVNAAEESRDIARLKMQQFILDNADPATWDDGARKIIEEQRKIYSRQKFSPHAKAMEDIDQRAFQDKFFADNQIAKTVRTVDNAITVSGKNLINKIANDDGTPTSAADIDKMMNIYQAALERKYSKDVAKVQMEETLKEAKKAYYINQSKLFPDDIIAQMQKKKKALGRGGSDKEGLEAKDYEDIISSAYMAKSLAEKSLDEKQEADRDMLGRGLDDGTITYSMINGTSLDEREQETYRLKMNAEAERLAKGEPIKIDQYIQSQLETEAMGIWRGDVSKEDILEKAREARFPAGGKPIIDDAGYARINTIAATAYKSYQANTLQEAESFALIQLVDLPTEYDLNERLKVLMSQFEKDQTISLRKLQFANHDKYRKALKDWFKAHPEADADEIYKQSRMLLVQYRKTPQQLRADEEARKPADTTEHMKNIWDMYGKILAGPKTESESGPPVPAVKNEHYIRVVNSWKDIPESMQSKILALVGAGVSYEEIVGAEDLKPYLRGK